MSVPVPYTSAFVENVANNPNVRVAGTTAAGPFIVGNNFYSVQLELDTLILEVYKSADGATWTKLADGPVLNDQHDTYAFFPIGTTAHVLYVNSAGNVAYIALDLLTETWGASTDTGIDGRIDYMQTYCGIAADSNRLVLLSNNANTNTCAYTIFTISTLSILPWADCGPIPARAEYSTC